MITSCHHHTDYDTALPVQKPARAQLSKAKKCPPKCWDIVDTCWYRTRLNIKKRPGWNREQLSSDHSPTSNQPSGGVMSSGKWMPNVCCLKLQGWFDCFGIPAAMKKAIHKVSLSLSITFPFSCGWLRGPAHFLLGHLGTMATPSSELLSPNHWM